MNGRLMTDEQKQIKEIKEIKKYIGCVCVTEEALRSHRSKVKKEIEERKEVYAKRFYNAGYRRIPKNAVVVSRAEYNDLKGLEKHFDDYLIKEIVATRKETAKEILQELCGHGTTYVKKWIKERYGVEAE